jgi:hypothetical protein
VPLDGLVHGRAKIGGRRLGEGVERLGGHGLSVSRRDGKSLSVCKLEAFIAHESRLARKEASIANHALCVGGSRRSRARS